MLPSVQARKELETCKKLCIPAKTCCGEKVGVGNAGTRGNFCVTKTAEDLQVSSDSSGSLKEHTSVHLILLISLHSIPALMGRM